MATVAISPQARQQYESSTGAPLIGGKLFTYLAGTTTKKATYTDSTGTTTNTNPIVLNSMGMTPSGLWLESGVSYKFVLAPATDTDPPTSPIYTEDSITGLAVVGVGGVTTTPEWTVSGWTPTYISASSFSVTADHTSDLHAGRRLQMTCTGGVIYGSVASSSYGAGVTTVTVYCDSGTLDSGLSAVDYSLISAVNTSAPNPYTPVGTIAHYAQSTPPSGWLEMNGSAKSRATYAALYKALVTDSGFASKTFTVTIAAPAVFSCTGHGFKGDERIRLSTTGALPTGLNTSTDYYVIYVGANSFRVETVPGQSTGLTTSGTQSGTHSLIQSLYGLGDGSTTFNIPDARGLFYRGWDNSAGVDTNRTLGSYQVDDMLSHRHTTNSSNWVAVASGSGTTPANWSAGAGNSGYYGGTETRGKNIAFLPCIKY